MSALSKEQLKTLLTVEPEPNDYVTQLKNALASVDDPKQLKAALASVDDPK